jgi:hypothetical protein
LDTEHEQERNIAIQRAVEEEGRKITNELKEYYEKDKERAVCDATTEAAVKMRGELHGQFQHEKEKALYWLRVEMEQKHQLELARLKNEAGGKKAGEKREPCLACAHLHSCRCGEYAVGSVQTEDGEQTVAQRKEPPASLSPPAKRAKLSHDGLADGGGGGQAATAAAAGASSVTPLSSGKPFGGTGKENSPQGSVRQPVEKENSLGSVSQPADADGTTSQQSFKLNPKQAAGEKTMEETTTAAPTTTVDVATKMDAEEEGRNDLPADGGDEVDQPQENGQGIEAVQIRLIR